ncbi:MAG: GNAT family N-acetyltransferase [Chloroflexota bacterium]
MSPKLIPIIRRADHPDVDWMQTSFATTGGNKREGYFAECCRLQDEGRLVLLLAEYESTYLGHCKIIWQPTHPYFKEHDIPEIQDLNVSQVYRRQGIATRLMDEAERIVGHRTNTIGIGFALYQAYGAAQRMYVLRGYVPDGQGIVYNDAYVEPGQSYRVDDDLVLGLIKHLDHES